jgi:hypothetical protein
MAWFISFACNEVQPVHKGVTGIGASASTGRIDVVGSFAIGWTMSFGKVLGCLMAANLAVVKISAEINCHAAFDLPELCLCGRGRPHLRLAYNRRGGLL